MEDLSKDPNIPFIEAVEYFMSSEELASLCPDAGYCPSCDGEYTEEAFFSHSRCECCNGLPGDRYHCTAYHEPSKLVVCYNICPDCVQYIVNGELPY